MRRNFGILGKEIIPNSIVGTSGVFDTFDHFVYKKHSLWPKLASLSFTNENFQGTIVAIQSTPFYVLENSTISFTCTLPDTAQSTSSQTFYWRVKHIQNSQDVYFEAMSGSFSIEANQSTGTFSVSTKFTGNFQKNSSGENRWIVQVAANSPTGIGICETSVFSTTIAQVTGSWSTLSINEGDSVSANIVISNIGTKTGTIPINIEYYGTSTNADFSGGTRPTTTQVILGNNSVTYTVIDDNVVEENETFGLQFKYNGYLLADLGTVTIKKQLILVSNFPRTMKLGSSATTGAAPSGWIDLLNTSISYYQPTRIADDKWTTDGQHYTYTAPIPATWSAPPLNASVSWGSGNFYIHSAGWVSFSNRVAARGDSLYGLNNTDTNQKNWYGASHVIGTFSDTQTVCTRIMHTTDNKYYKTIRFESSNKGIWEITFFNPALVYDLPSNPTSDDITKEGFYGLKFELVAGSLTGATPVKWMVTNSTAMGDYWIYFANADNLNGQSLWSFPGYGTAAVYGRGTVTYGSTYGKQWEFSKMAGVGYPA